MSIVSDLLHGKITWDTAKTEIETWGSQVTQQLGSSPAVAAATSGVIADLKQAASDAITTADTLAGPIIATGATAVEVATDVAIKTYLGPFGNIASPLAHDAIDKIASGLKATIDAVAMEAKAGLKPANAIALGSGTGGAGGGATFVAGNAGANSGPPA
jgi:hypothetical protein